MKNDVAPGEVEEGTLASGTACNIKNTSKAFPLGKPPKRSLSISFLDDQLIIGGQSIALAPRTIYNGIIFKPSELVAKLSAHLRLIKLKNPTATICLPPSANLLAIGLPFFVLQYTLILANSGLQIINITSGDDSTNLLSLLQRPGKKSPVLWLSVTLFALGVLGVFIGVKHQEATAYHAMLTSREAFCKQTNSNYEKQYKQTNELKAKIKNLQEKLIASQSTLHDMHNPMCALNALAHHTPASIYLTTLNLKENAKLLGLTIKGSSPHSSVISKFLKNLGGKKCGINNPVLLSVIKEKRAPRVPVANYNFIIEGELPAA